MIIPEENEKDLIRQHFSSEMIEKAPEGFTQKVMNRIAVEAKPVKKRVMLHREIMIPVISLIIIAVLVTISFITTSDNYELGNVALSSLTRHIDLSFVKASLDALFSFKLPIWLPGLFVSILFLTVFDRALRGLFHKEN